MKNFLLSFIAFVVFSLNGYTQVTQINNNSSLHPMAILNSTTAIAISSIDQSLWATDGTAGGTIQLSTTIRASSGGTVFNGNYIFVGSTAAEGTEIFISDGTVSGTKIIEDIVPGTGSSTDSADQMAVLNGYVYFIASTPATGRELWRTDGTAANTSLVMDIVPGATGSNTSGAYRLASAGTFLLFNVNTAAAGNELWRSDGTAANTFLVKDIIPGPTSSNPHGAGPVGNYFLFSVAAADGVHNEIWRTDGTTAGTILLISGINPGFAGAANYNLGVHLFGSRSYFIIDDGVHASGIWSTDGVDATSSHTSFLQDEGIVAPFNTITTFLIADAFNLTGKFIFPVTDGTTRFELWESDGATAAGTKLMVSFPPNANNNFPFIFVNYGYNPTLQTLTYPLFNGNFFLAGNSIGGGHELWKSDGTAAGTVQVKDVNPGVPDGITAKVTYFYTSAGLYFSSTDGVNGNELWKSDGTTAGTTLVKDINPSVSVNQGNSDPAMSFIVNNKLLFTATDGDNPVQTDLYVVDGIFNPLPVKLLDFVVSPKAADAILTWHTAQEINSKNYTVQRSFDGRSFVPVGTVAAINNSAVTNSYSLVDAGIINSGRAIVFYRLVSTDADGKESMSPIITLKISGNDKWNVSLLNNPVVDNLKIILTGITDKIQFTVIDVNGRKLMSSSMAAVNGQISLPVASLPHGVYSLLTESLNNQSVIRFVK